MQINQYIGREVLFRGSWAIVEGVVEENGSTILEVMDQDGRSFRVKASNVDFY